MKRSFREVFGSGESLNTGTFYSPDQRSFSSQGDRMVAVLDVTNSLERLQYGRDVNTSEFPEFFPETELKSFSDGVAKVQPLIEGSRFDSLVPEDLLSWFVSHPEQRDLLIESTEFFLEFLAQKKHYVDLSGAKDAAHNISRSRNLFVTEEGLVNCDVGLGISERTIGRDPSFFSSPDVKILEYQVRRMRDWLISLKGFIRTPENIRERVRSITDHAIIPGEFPTPVNDELLGRRFGYEEMVSPIRLSPSLFDDARRVGNEFGLINLGNSSSYSTSTREGVVKILKKGKGEKLPLVTLDNAFLVESVESPLVESIGAFSGEVLQKIIGVKSPESLIGYLKQKYPGSSPDLNTVVSLRKLGKV